MHTLNSPRQLGDFGGADARFGWRTDREAPRADAISCACAEPAWLESAIRHELAEHGKERPPGCAIEIANPFLGDAVERTKHHALFSQSESRRELDRCRIPNLVIDPADAPDLRE